MNVIKQLEFEHGYFEVAVEHFIQYAIHIPKKKINVVIPLDYSENC